MKRRMISILMTFVMVLSLIQGTGIRIGAEGEKTPVAYRYPVYNNTGETATAYEQASSGIKEWEEEGSCTNYTEVTASSASAVTWGIAEAETWVVVKGGTAESPITIPGVTVLGDVHLILTDGCNLNITVTTSKAGICVSGDNNSLTIYGQGDGSGTLTATGGNNSAGIGGDYGSDGGRITINGGVVTAAGGGNGAGIGGGSYKQIGDPSSQTISGGNGSDITINGGTVTATGGSNGAGIGGGHGGDGGHITINGGKVTATAGDSGAGIGGGQRKQLGTGSSATYFGGNGSDITINGGTVTATSNGKGAAIGGGFNGSGSKIIINGGNVTAQTLNGGVGAGIGGGFNGSGSNITINGGTVIATVTEGGAAIGGGKGGSGSAITINGGEVTATGGTSGAGIGAGNGSKCSGSDITITGGIVTATGGTYASTNNKYSGAGIGGGHLGNGSAITISGGTVTATGGEYGGAGIGGGLSATSYEDRGSGSDITISGGIVTATGGCEGAAGIGSGYYGGSASNIKAAANVLVKAGDSANPETVIEHDATTDLAGKTDFLKRYVTAAKPEPMTIEKNALIGTTIIPNEGIRSAGSTVKYTITLTNSSSVESTVEIVDVLPDGFPAKNINEISDNGDNTNETTIVWKNITIPAASGGIDGEKVLTYNAKLPQNITSETTYTNTAYITKLNNVVYTGEGSKDNKPAVKTIKSVPKTKISVEKAWSDGWDAEVHKDETVYANIYSSIDNGTTLVYKQQKALTKTAQKLENISLPAVDDSGNALTYYVYEAKGKGSTEYYIADEMYGDYKVSYSNEGNAYTITNAKLSTVTNTNDVASGEEGYEGSLRWALAQGGHIKFDSSLSGKTITLSSKLEISKDVTIDASGLAKGITIDGNKKSFEVNSCNVNLIGLTITNGDSSQGLFYIDEGTDHVLTMKDCVVKGCGIGVYVFGMAKMENCLITDNNAGLKFDTEENITITNCTVAGNTTGLSNSGDNVVLQNSIIAKNTTDVSNSGTINAYNTLSSFKDWSGGEKNIEYDNTKPLFVDDANGDYHLITNSQAYNQGNNTYCTETKDLDGYKRVMYDTIDLGAYEYQYTFTAYKGTFDGQEHDGLTLSEEEFKAEPGTVSYIVDGAEQTKIPSFRGAGTYSIYIVVKRDGYKDYSQKVSCEIKRATVTISDVDAQEKDYDAKIAAEVEYEASGIIDGTNAQLGYTAEFENKNAGDDKAVSIRFEITVIDPAGQHDDCCNYEIVVDGKEYTPEENKPWNVTTTDTANISKATLTVSGTTVSAKNYDGNATAAVTPGTLEGIQSDESGTADDVSIDKATGIFDDVETGDGKNAGEDKSVTVVYTLSGTAAANYTVSNSEHTATINKREITVTPDANQSKGYGEKDPALTYDYEVEGGVITGETVKFSGKLSRTEGEDIAENAYEITLGDLALADNDDFLADNYELKLSETKVYFTIVESCKYADPLNAGKYTLLLGGEEAGTFTIEGSSSKGFSLKAENGQYIAFSDKKVTESGSSYTWKYDGGLYAEVKTTTTSGSAGFWSWFGWGRKSTSTTTTTKYYLSINGTDFTLSTSKVTAEIQVTAEEHTWAYYHDGDGKHEAYCTKCGHREDPKKHDYTYDSENHECICGKVDPDYGGVTSVSVKESANTTTSYGWGWGFWGYSGKTKVSSYSYTISTKQINVTVKKIEYSVSKDGTMTKVSGQKITSGTKLSGFYLDVTDSNDVVTHWYFDGKETKQLE